jgi:hypothetical protein
VKSGKGKKKTGVIVFIKITPPTTKKEKERRKKKKSKKEKDTISRPTIT